MSKPYRSSLRKHPHAVVLIEWPPRVRPIRDFEWFHSVDAMQEYFGTWCEYSEGADHPIVIAEVVDTAAMTLARVAAFGDGAERRAELIKAQPDRLIAKRENRANANISWITETLATGGDFSYLDDVMAQQLDDLLAQNIAWSWTAESRSPTTTFGKASLSSTTTSPTTFICRRTTPKAGTSRPTTSTRRWRQLAPELTKVSVSLSTATWA